MSTHHTGHSGWQLAHVVVLWLLPQLASPSLVSFRLTALLSLSYPPELYSHFPFLEPHYYPICGAIVLRARPRPCPPGDLEWDLEPSFL